MNDMQRGWWLISPKRLIELLGAEYEILNQAGGGVLGKFYLAALAIVVTLFVSIGSIWYAIALLFHDWLVEVLLSAFFSLLFACIYIFLINTLSKEPLPGPRRFFRFANIIRSAFIVFIAFMVAQPLAVLAGGEKLQEKTSEHKAQVLDRHLAAIATFYDGDLQKLSARMQYCIDQRTAFQNHHYDNEMAAIESTIEDIRSKAAVMGGEATRKVKGSSFFVYQVQQACHYTRSWVVIVFCVCLFLLPGYLIYSIASDNTYYLLKGNRDHKIVLEAYEGFVKKYKEIFLQRFDVDIEIFSRFDDLPFRRIRKTPLAAETEKAFVEKFITAAD